MNCYTRDPEPKGRKGYNQSPAVFDKDNVQSDPQSAVSTMATKAGPSGSTGTAGQGLASENSVGVGNLDQNSDSDVMQAIKAMRRSSVDKSSATRADFLDVSPLSPSESELGNTSMTPAIGSGNNAANDYISSSTADVELARWHDSGNPKSHSRTGSSASSSKSQRVRPPTANMSKDDTTVEVLDQSDMHDFEDANNKRGYNSTVTLNEFTYDSDSDMYPSANNNQSDRARLMEGGYSENNGDGAPQHRSTARNLQRARSNQQLLPNRSSSLSPSLREKLDVFIDRSYRMAVKYAKFVGPGVMVSVAYLDPGNYATAVSAGALYEYKHLFVILLSNLFAVFLQILCTKLGGVTGLDLAQNCRQHLSRSTCIAIYVLAEIAIIATDLAEVVGTAIALNILFGIPLAWGVVLTVLDVFLVLMAYRPNGPMKFVRYFEYMVSALVFVVVVCFAVELAEIKLTDASDIWRGFLPSKELIESKGLYLSCGILGATVMPHSLYLGSGLVQPRLREYDSKHGYIRKDSVSGDYADLDGTVEYNTADIDSAESISSLEAVYRPSIHAIKYAMNFSIAELVISLFTVAIFVNSAILIVAGSTLYGAEDAVDADLLSIYSMLTRYLGKIAGVVFALALLFSGQSAGIVCTLAGQIVSEGFLHWSFRPWIRRTVTRALAIAPCLFVSLFVGRKGLATVLNASQVVLSLLLPFVSAPLLYFTCNKKIMRVPKHTASIHDSTNNDVSEDADDLVEYVDMSNSTLTNVTAVLIFAFITILNCFMVFSMATGEA